MAAHRIHRRSENNNFNPQRQTFAELFTGSDSSLTLSSHTHRGGATFASRARAAELKAHTRRLDSTDTDPEATSDHLTNAGDMPKKRMWRPLDLSQVEESSARLLSYAGRDLSDSPSPQRDRDPVVFQAQDSSEADTRVLSDTTGSKSRFVLPSSRPSADYAALLARRTYHRRQRSGQSNDVADEVSVEASGTAPTTITMTDPRPHPTGPADGYPFGPVGSSEPARYGEPTHDSFRSFSYRQVTPSQDGNDEMSRHYDGVRDNLSRYQMTRQSYPAVKGTSGDDVFNRRRMQEQKESTRQSRLDVYQEALGPGGCPTMPSLAALSISSYDVNNNRPMFPGGIPRRDPFEGVKFDDLSDPPPGSYRDPFIRDSNREREELDAWWYTDNRFDTTSGNTIANAWSAAKYDHQGQQRPDRSGFSVGVPGDRRSSSATFVSDNTSSSANGSIVKSTTKEEAEENVRDLILPVMAILEAYRHGPRDYFNGRFVEPASWCIDRSPAGLESAFGKDWGTPPARVGRDPRYRAFQGERRSSPQNLSPTASRGAAGGGSSRARIPRNAGHPSRGNSIPPEPRQRGRAWRSEESSRYYRRGGPTVSGNRAW